MARASNLGFARLGLQREWKKASEAYWLNKSDALRAELREELEGVARELVERHLRLQLEAGIELVPVNDFAYYDHVLETAYLLGAVPPRFERAGESEIDTVFAMARGRQDAPAMEMTKWFDTNYHYIVPELSGETRFSLRSERPFQALALAQRLGIQAARPVLLGPVSFLLLSKSVEQGFDHFSLLPPLLEVYAQVLERFAGLGADWVQLDEPYLLHDLEPAQAQLFAQAYARLQASSARPKLLIATYFGGIAHNLELALSLGEGLHLDLVRSPEQLDAILDADDGARVLSLGLVDGRNIWRNDLDASLSVARHAARRLGGSERLWLSPSCSLLHAPIDLDAEQKLDPELRAWLAFGKQKLREVTALTTALQQGEEATWTASVREAFAASRDARVSRGSSPRVHDPAVRARVESIDAGMRARPESFAERSKAQRERLALPLLPTTTIGSFPQTKELRRLRSELKKGKLSEEAYEQAIREEIASAIRAQEELGLDVLVHGEFERNDMVEYFGERLSGYAFTQNGWVQSYGSRAVKPPIIFGDVSRPVELSVSWARYAQSCSERPVKGMLTGPVTMLQWSFVRDDQPREKTCEQLALAIRDEVVELEAAAISVIQIDEPAFREGLPLRQGDWADYLRWAVASFRLASSGVRAQTQIHSHMCYSEFNSIFDAIAALDADVLSIEASRSRMELLDAFEDFAYPNDIGPGVYDIHSPRIPSVEEMEELLVAALRHVPVERLWVNPDCGLKTRGWEEVRSALSNMVEAARRVRSTQAQGSNPE
ncbi:MAG: 5-methyltetrahydropteroyltriglutamate--homocysteine S-methyltransferase [Myxococcota bacterium]|jgi:5-methyltetrahydropteroyltriglutamate--homocysteine methyltransferase|nr:5-methyltetrahydropteroyltriglutamate--homocysteine S-methyltransferase [Myxococcota bacterium]